jgi:hypothetical protein
MLRMVDASLALSQACSSRASLFMMPRLESLAAKEPRCA